MGRIAHTGKVLALGFLATICVMTSTSADSLTYANSRFGVALTFPADWFETRAQLPENGDGVLFTSADGASLAIWGSNNALDATPASMAIEARARKEPGYQITYERSGRDWLVLSGHEDGLIFYERIEFGSDGVLRGFLLKYPPDTRQKYEPGIAALANSLSAN